LTIHPSVARTNVLTFDGLLADITYEMEDFRGGSFVGAVAALFLRVPG